jgi:PAS domain S-box-containing protein
MSSIVSPESGQNSKAMKILHVDDTDAQRYALSRVLRHAGFDVLEARTGRQALDLASQLPDLVILDVNLPDIDGFAVCKQIKANEATARIPVLHLSATMVSTEARVAGLDGGADAYLVQPVQQEELLATVRALLRVRKAEEALWTSERQYRLFFEANPLSCWVFSASDLRILAVNEAAVQQYGYSREEFVRLSTRDIMADESLPGDMRTNGPAPAFQNGTVQKHKTKSGKVLDVEEVWAPLHLNGKDARLAIVQDITAKLLREESQRREEMQRLLLERVLKAQEDERQRISRELHDEAGQLMTSLLVGLRSLGDARQLKEAKNQAKELRKITSKAIEEVGRLARGLHSSVLDQFGLKEAIERVATEHSSLHHVPVGLDFGETPFSELDTQLQIGIYRIIQEALTNVARHSQATSVSVRFEWRGPFLKLIIRDDGLGFRSRNLSELPSKHLGIEGMRQRAIILGGALDIKSEPGKGTLIEVRLPVSRSGSVNSGGVSSL